MKKLAIKRVREEAQEDSNEEGVPARDLKSGRNLDAPVPSLPEPEAELEQPRPTRNSEQA